MKILVELGDGKYYFARNMRDAMVRAYRNHKNTHVSIYDHETEKHLGNFFWKDAR